MAGSGSAEKIQLRLSPRHAYSNVKIHQNINQTKTKSKDIKSNNKKRNGNDALSVIDVDCNFCEWVVEWGRGAPKHKVATRNSLPRRFCMCLSV